jgi:hypothetical protein
VKESENSLSNYFVMGGNAAEYCHNKNVPHGAVQQIWFHSKTTDKMTRFHVYTPPGFENIDEKLPILVLQYGGVDNDASWVTIGRANFIMDNLYADEKAKRILVVMPMGHPTDGFFGGLGIDDDPLPYPGFGNVLAHSIYFPQAFMTNYRRNR